jgi:hypothetical protein
MTHLAVKIRLPDGHERTLITEHEKGQGTRQKFGEQLAELHEAELVSITVTRLPITNYVVHDEEPVAEIPEVTDVEE